ncbi:MAG TPA: hypothetical protein VFN21_09760 [Acidimicrobiales bacterium]|nr:hypothetical protein [Acidimicrobiales bacterium]
MSHTETTSRPAPVTPSAVARRGPGHIEVRQLPVPLDGSIAVRGWADDYLAIHGHDVCSSYVELFWLGALGPSSTVLLRRLARGLQLSPDGYRLPVVDTALSLGLGPPTSRNSPFVRALHRCVIFRVARFVGPDLEVRLKVPTLHAAQLRRLPDSLQAAHDVVVSRRHGVADDGRPSDRGSTDVTV